MHIELLGLSGVKIQSSETVVLLSPPSEKSELKSSRMKADIVVLGKPSDKINVDPRAEKLFIIENSGEYESSGVFIYSIANPAKGEINSLLTSITMEGITIAHLGSLNSELTEAQIDLFEGADILMIPVGGNDVLDEKRANDIVAKLEPRIVIPMHFAQKGIKTKYNDVANFLKEVGSQVKAEEKFKITKKDLPQETMEVVYLSP